MIFKLKTNKYLCSKNGDKLEQTVSTVCDTVADEFTYQQKIHYLINQLKGLFQDDVKNFVFSPNVYGYMTSIDKQHCYFQMDKIFPKAARQRFRLRPRRATDGLTALSRQGKRDHRRIRPPGTFFRFRQTADASRFRRRRLEDPRLYRPRVCRVLSQLPRACGAAE